MSGNYPNKPPHPIELPPCPECGRRYEFHMSTCSRDGVVPLESLPDAPAPAPEPLGGMGQLDSFEQRVWTSSYGATYGLYESTSYNEEATRRCIVCADSAVNALRRYRAEVNDLAGLCVPPEVKP